ncbi:MAG: nucleoside triphosphate pyrophosphohydrolase [Gammaproteobacteria bacterium]|jgi:predicted house-cleaning noncanonical NTP pyrophosphatase (MazG superfamily)
MNRKKFGFRNSVGQIGKIARDNFLEGTLREDATAKISYKYLTGQELQACLLEKLVEETTEVCDAGDLQNLTEELADVLQVVETIRKHNNISKKDLETVLSKKRETRGAFDKGLFIEWIELGLNSDLCKYCLSYPNKYPQIEHKK